MGCWNQIAESVLHEWELKKRLKKFKAKFRYTFTIFLSTLTQRIKYSLTEKWKNDFNRIWSEFGKSRIVIYSPESRIFSCKIEKSLKLSSSIMTFRKIPIYFDLREEKKKKQKTISLRKQYFISFSSWLTITPDLLLNKSATAGGWCC